MGIYKGKFQRRYPPKFQKPGQRSDVQSLFFALSKGAALMFDLSSFGKLVAAESPAKY